MTLREKKQPNPPGQCIFCGKRGKRSGEHIFPEWFSKIVPRTEERHHSALAQVEDHTVLPDVTFIRREGDLASRKLKAPCKECNEVWMSQIETASIPILTPLILGQPITLTADAQRIVATWATLKTLVIETDDPKSAAIPPQAAKQFYVDKKPFDDWKIWIGQYFGTTWSQGKRMTHLGGVLGPSAMKSVKTLGKHQRRNIQTTTIVGGQLYIHVFSATVSNTFYGFKGRSGDVLNLIHPYSGDIGWPPKVVMTDDDAGQIALSLAAAVPRSVTAT